MHELLKQLMAQRANLLQRQRDTIDTIQARGQDTEWSAEERETISRFDADLNDIDQRIGEVERAIERSQDESTAETRQALSTSANEGAGGRDLETELRQLLAGERRSVTIRAPQNDPVLSRMGGAPTWQRRDLSVGTDTAGGHTVETSFYRTLVEHMIEVSGILRSGATILRTDSGETIQIPTTTTHPTAILVGEGVAITESDPVFAQRELGAYKYAVLNQVTSELAQDTSVDLLGYLARACGRAVGNAFGVHAITGDGSSKPNGVQAQATTGKTGATGVAGAFDADDLIDLYFSVIEPYRNDPSCVWMLRDASVATMRKLKDDQGQYLWSPATVGGMPSTFLDKPVVTDPNVPAVALSADSVLFGAMSAYFVRQVNEIRFERSDHYAFNQDLITFRTIVRMDGITVDQTGAIKTFTGGAS